MLSFFRRLNLYLANLFWRRELQISEIHCDEAVIINDNSVRLFWQASGCHKIIIKNIGIYSGDSFQAVIQINDCSQPITVYFYGVRNRAERKIHLKSVKVSLLTSFEAVITARPVAETDYSNKEIAATHSVIELNAALSEWSSRFGEINLAVNLSEPDWSFDVIETNKT